MTQNNRDEDRRKFKQSLLKHVIAYTPECCYFIEKEQIEKERLELDFVPVFRPDQLTPDESSSYCPTVWMPDESLFLDFLKLYIDSSKKIDDNQFLVKPSPDLEFDEEDITDETEIVDKNSVKVMASGDVQDAMIDCSFFSRVFYRFLLALA